MFAFAFQGHISIFAQFHVPAGRGETAGRHMFSVLSGALKSIDGLKATRR